MQIHERGKGSGHTGVIYGRFFSKNFHLTFVAVPVSVSVSVKIITRWISDDLLLEKRCSEIILYTLTIVLTQTLEALFEEKNNVSQKYM